MKVKGLEMRLGLGIPGGMSPNWKENCPESRAGSPKRRRVDSVLFTFLCLGQNTTSKTTRRRERLLWLTAPEWWESMTALARTSGTAWHCGQWHARWQEQEAESPYLSRERETDRASWKCHGFFSKPVPSEVLPPARLNHLNLPKQQCQPGTKCPNVWDYGRHFSLKPPHSTPWTPQALGQIISQDAFSPT